MADMDVSDNAASYQTMDAIRRSARPESSAPSTPSAADEYVRRPASAVGFGPKHAVGTGRRRPIAEDFHLMYAWVGLAGVIAGAIMTLGGQYVTRRSELHERQKC